jgi:hypothetical protein
MKENADLKLMNKLLHCVNVVYYTQKVLKKRRAKLNDFNIPDNIKSRWDELARL